MRQCRACNLSRYKPLTLARYLIEARARKILANYIENPFVAGVLCLRVCLLSARAVVLPVRGAWKPRGGGGTADLSRCAKWRKKLYPTDKRLCT